MIHPKQIAKAALFNDAGELLILTRSKTDKTRPGRFDFAGGSLDENESPLEAVVREIREEIGVNVAQEAIHLMYSDTTWYNGLSTVRYLFVGRVPTEIEITLSFEHDDWQWMPMDAVLQRYDHPVWIGGLKYLMDHELL